MTLWRLPATTLSGMLDRHEVSAVEVLGAHVERIDAVDARIRAFTEVLREPARADAEASDARRARGESRGPLDGVPVTVKECFDVAGRATTLGIPSWAGRIAERDAAMVTALRQAGAVVLGRTNLSQTMLYVEARNPLFGQTANPWSLAHSPGGSSGGEGAAVAAGMSPLGIGTDIGGSIRTPAHFCGVAGFKPSLDRLPMRGYRSVLAGQEAVRGMGGPIARTVGDLMLLFRALDRLDLSSLDPRVPPMGHDAPENARIDAMRIGFYCGDGVLTPSKAVSRAVLRAMESLRARGCAVTLFEPPDVRGVLSAYLGALSADGGAGIVAALAGGEVDPVLEPLRRMASVPGAARRVMARAARAFGQANLALMLEAMGEKSVSELWALTDRLRTQRSSLVDAMERSGVDVLLCPPFATPALPHGASKNFTLASSYSIVFNAAQLPAGVVPVTRVRPDESSRTAGRDALERQAAKIDAASAGLPVGVQVVGRAWRDREVLAVMQAIESDVSHDDGYPATPVEPAP
ncbi:MAG TPA: amidase family protein [Polyangiaceae bacterium]